LHFIKTIFSKYSHWIWAVLSPLGAWGVFAIAFIDAALIGMPLDAVVGGYVYHNPHLFWLYTAIAAAGSAAGSMIIYAIGYKGGEVLLQKRMPAARFAKIKKSFEDHEFLALMFPAMLPPPTPYKLIVLSAAAFEMDWRKFLMAIFLGRVARFTILSILVIKLGPQAVGLVATLARRHLPATLMGLAVLILLGVAIWKLRSRRQNGNAAPAGAV
jgi:membrane protein YqaA with SNARE-associated domain